MKKYALILFIFSFVLCYSYAQLANEPTCIVLIDEKLIYCAEIQIIWNNSTTSDTISTYSRSSELYLTKEDKKILNNLPDTTVFSIIIEENVPYDFKNSPYTRKISYHTSFNWKISELIDPNNYFIFNITNFNKQKGIYYMDEISKDRYKLFEYKKEYGNRRKAIKKIKKVIPDHFIHNEIQIQ